MTDRRRVNLLGGLVMGLVFSVILSVGVGVLYWIGGPTTSHDTGWPLPSLIGLYVFGGVTGGLLLGLMLPLTTWRWGAVLVGMIVATPVYLAVGLIEYEDPIDIVAGLIVAGVVGGCVGYGLWSPPSSPEVERHRVERSG